MVLFRPGETQMYYLYAADKPETYWVHFTGSDVDLLLDYYRMPKNENVFFTGTSPDYQWLFRQMIQELQLMRVNYEDLLNMNLRHIFLIINRYLVEGNKVGTEMLDEVEKAAHYFNEHYNEPISIEEYAQSRGMSVSWFQRNFKQFINHSPTQYILMTRVNNAASLLETTDYNMAEISAIVGYDDQLYFSRLFRKLKGMSPSQYRKLLTEKEKKSIEHS